MKMVAQIFLFILCTFSISVHASDRIDVHSESSLKNAFEKNETLTPWVALKLAELYNDQNKYAATLEILDQVPDSDPWVFWKNILKAEALAQTKKPQEALTLLNNLPPQPDIEHNEDIDFYRSLYRRALLTQKQALEANGENSRAVVSKIWGLFPGLATETPPAGTTIENKLDRILVLKVLKRGDEIPSFVSPGEIASSHLLPALKCQGLFDYSQALRLKSKIDAALQGYIKAVDVCTGDNLYKSLFWKGKLSLQQKQLAEGISAYEKLAHDYPDSRYADDAIYGLMKIYAAQNQPDKSKAMREKLLSGSGDMKAQLLWDDAYEAYKRKDYTTALRLLDDLLKGGPASDESYPQALYWKARITEKSEKKSGSANKIYAQVVSEFPFSFYAALAANRLGTVVKVPSLPALKYNSSSDSISEQCIQVIEALVSNNLDDEARNAIDYFAQAYPDSQATNKPLWASLWNLTGDYHQTLMIAASDLELNHTHPDTHNALAAALYPLAYPQEVAFASQKKSLPRGMILGIMREESLFIPKVRSSVGAIGLMQLMPTTARLQAKKDSLGGDLNLEIPKTNILVGASFFKEMLNYFDDQLPLAIMAYNAGPGNVNKWLRARKSLPLDEFVEEIPFNETRGYIRRVLRSMQVYGALTNDPAFKKPFFSMTIK